MDISETAHQAMLEEMQVDHYDHWSNQAMKLNSKASPIKRISVPLQSQNKKINNFCIHTANDNIADHENF
jgi:hypothetical protein